MPRSKTYYVAPIAAPPPTSYGLFDLDGAWIASTVGAIETRKRRSFFRSDEDYSSGYQALSEMEWRLVMDATQTLVSEIRSARGAIPPNTDYSLETYAAGLYPGIQLADVVGSLNTNGRSAAAILASIETILQQQQAGEDGQLEALARIVFLLGGA